MNILSLSLNELQAWLKKENFPSFHAKQIFSWIFEKKILDFESMSNLSFDLRNLLKSSFRLEEIRLKKMEKSKDEETVKFLFELRDQYFIESVLILAPGRKTVCVSSQVGCPMGCVFCASGQKGFFRNLTQEEILLQILFIEKLFGKISHVVFMGMGEPLKNEQIFSVIEKIRQDLKISSRKISLSTVGVVDRMQKMIEKDLKINLVVSLHAPSQELRERIIPSAKKNSINEILNLCQAYFKKTKRDILFEYTLIKDFNDGEKEAHLLGELIKDLQCSVNLIPLNPVENFSGKRPDKHAVYRFKKILAGYSVPAFQRYTKGTDIQAACGQLAFQRS